MKFNFYALKICVVCVIVFIFQYLVAGLTDMLILNKLAYFEVWRFFTSLFLHADIGHLFYNMFALALFGSMLERMIGDKRFLIVYFSAGIIANIFALQFYDSSLGASGAIYGIIGALVIVRPSLMVWAFGFPMPMFIAGILWAVGDIIGLFMPSNVGHIAHLGGMIIGLILGYAFKKYYLQHFGENRIVGGAILDENRMRNWEDAHLR